MTEAHAGNYTPEELQALGFRSVGNHVQIHRTVQIFGAANLTIGSHVRIDVFAVLSAGASGFTIEDHVHIASNASILGAGAPVLLSAFSGVSPRATLFTSTDDFSGGYLSGPTVPSEFTNVRSGPITLGRHAIVGAGSIVLPGVTIGTAATVGALTLVKHDVEEFTIVAGNPLRVVGRRGDGLLELERELLARERGTA
ncbi:MAG TPA: acyltransferase [Thermoanaerobaculia bacterium]|nr:acyltransferase [Thermoanaerobaculia bacterium]